MPKINTQVRESGDDVVEGEVYEVMSVEDIKTEANQFSCFRVGLRDSHSKEGTIMLWQRPITTHNSKLGVFIDTFGDDTDQWLKRKFKILSWKEKERKIERVK